MSKDVSQWLDGLGLGQYAASFLEHEVEPEILPELCDGDLKEMGVAALGHRKTLLKAIELLRRDGPDAPPLEHAEADAGDGPAADSDVTAWSRTPGERKPVTLLFADIVNFTPLASVLTPKNPATSCSLRTSRTP